MCTLRRLNWSVQLGRRGGTATRQRRSSGCSIIPPPVQRRRRHGKPWSGDRAGAGPLSASDCFAVVAQNVTNPHPRHSVPMNNTPLPASETAPSPTIKRLASSAPGRLPQKMIVGAFPLWPGRFSHCCFGRGRSPRILPVFAKNSTPRRFP